MALYRQTGAERFAIRGHDFRQGANGNGAGGGGSDQISIRIPHKQGRGRRRSDKSRRISVGTFAVIICLILAVTVIAFSFISRNKENNDFNNNQDDNGKIDMDFLSNVTRTKGDKVVKFGRGSGTVGRDSRYWDRDDRRRDDEYDADAFELANSDDVNQSTKKDDTLKNEGNGSEQLANVHAHRKSNGKPGENRRGAGLYNEAGRDELKLYEAEYEASLKNIGQSSEGNADGLGLSNSMDTRLQDEDVDAMDAYYDGIDYRDLFRKELDDTGHNDVGYSDVKKGGTEVDGGRNIGSNSIKEVEITNEIINNIFEDSQSTENVQKKPSYGNISDGETMKGSSSKKKTDSRKGKRRKFSGSSCDMKFLNSTAELVEPLQGKKFSRFSLQYTEREDRPIGSENWEPRFAGHQTLQEREDSFYARDQKINCGFIKGPEGYPSTGFDLTEDDARYMSSCHIAVSSCIFGNSDNLRTPTNKLVTRLSRKNVCFVMFMDEYTLQTLSSEGQKPDNTGFIGLWKIVVVKNLPYTDMRRVGKIPKFLTHRLFPSARYSIWLDSKLRLQSDPILILEYFLWRRGFEHAISNHYDRHCVWEEVMQNKKLNKFNHSVIDEQFAFYQKDGLTRFNASDPNKLLPSYVPEGSFIVREHTPMSNLFSCLWFNEVDRFTPRDQLSFAYTYLKLKRMNPGKHFHLNMFKDCERRSIAKLYHHRAEDKRGVPMQALG
ncbi:hypothetical protein AAC387_Pa07g2986 [Persea americana]